MTRTRTWITATTCLALASVAGGGGYAYLRGNEEAPAVTTAALARGTVVETISASGTVEAVTRVDVGTQVSGTVRDLLADFNSFVEKGQVLARLDPAFFETLVEQARAGVVKADADADRLRVALADVRAKLERATRLAEKNLLAASELEAADVAVRLAETQVKSAEAAAALARASLNQAEVNLRHTVITSPITGVVLSRDVDVGQTVAASMAAPTLFVLAADLTRMRVSVSLDESDVGRVEAGQPATFRVDAFPEATFSGRVTQVRLQPVVTQNVVTYETIVECANPDLSLKPGMTASVAIEVARAAGALVAPAAALRFVPSADVAAAFGLAAPSGRSGRTGSAGPAAGGGTAARTAASAAASTATLWVYDAGRIAPVTVTPGVSNGTQTEIRGDAVSAGTLVVTAATAPGAGAVAASQTRSPLMTMPAGPPR